MSFGGSGGQEKLNNEMYNFVKRANKTKTLQVMHVTGKRHYDEFISKLEEDNIILNKNIKVLPYLHEMPQAINIASMVITSAGAITLAEISALGLPSILIPKAYTAENHQEYNARAFEKQGASILVLEEDLKGDTLWGIIYNIINDKEKLLLMGKRSKELGNIDATNKIYKVIKSTINK